MATRLRPLERAGLLLGLLTSSLAHGAPPIDTGDQARDPNQCVVVLEEMGDVGLRISEAQSLAQTVLVGLQARVGYERAIYGGLAATARQMKRMLAGTPTGTTLQDKQIAAYEACEKHARFRVRARFSMKGKGHLITLTCRRNEKGAEPLKTAQFEAATFDAARAKVGEAMPTFCTAIKAPQP